MIRIINQRANNRSLYIVDERTGKKMSKNIKSEHTKNLSEKELLELQERVSNMSEAELKEFRNKFDPDTMGFYGEEAI